MSDQADDQVDAGGPLPLTPRFRMGDRIGDYVVDRFHAPGGWGDVYLAHHCSLDQGRVALKVSPMLSGDRLTFDSLTGIPNLVEILAAGIDEDCECSFVAMRFVMGTALDVWLDRPTPAGEEVRTMVRHFAEVALALATLHGRGFVHRDVKPANILLEEASGGRPTRAVLVDVGFVHRTGPFSGASTIVVSPPYSAPEQQLGLDLDGRADVFALGVTMHDVLAGRGPKKRRRPAAGLEPLAELVPDCDPALAAIVAKAVAPDRERRYPSAAALHADLLAWLAGRRVRALVRTRGQRMLAAMVWLAGAAWLGASIWWMVDGASEAAKSKHFAAALAAGDFDAAIEIGGVDSLQEATLTHGAIASELGGVVLLLRGGDVAAAMRRAAELISRDGLEAQPEITRWLVSQIHGQGESGRLAARLLSQALFDHPPLASPIASDVTHVLLTSAADVGSESVLHVVASLGALACTDQLLQIVELVLRRLDIGKLDLELLRLATANWHRISARAAAGSNVISAIADTTTAMEVVLRWLGSHQDNPLVQASAEAGMGQWFLALSRLRERGGMPPLRCRDLPWPWQPSMLELAAGREEGFAGESIAAQSPGDPGGEPFDVGFALGATGIDPAPWRDWPQRVARARAMDAERCELQFSAGLRLGIEDRRAPLAGFRSDPGATLAARLGPLGEFSPLPVDQSREPVPLDVLAEWRFTSQPPALSGTARGASGRSVRLCSDEAQPAYGYACLGCPGVSALRLSFDEPARFGTFASIVVSAQQGQRAALAHRGEAGIEILCDGRLVAGFPELRTVQSPELKASLGDLGQPRQRQIEIRLREDATTSVRIYSVHIE